MLITRLPVAVWLFALIQALAMSGGATMVLAGGIVGASLAPNTKLATLPVAMMIVGTAMGVLPVTRLMRIFGRKRIFIGASCVAGFAALIAAFATATQQFMVFLIASFTLGLSIAAFQQIRFAAIESAPPILAAKATSTVLLGGLVAAFLGPELVSLGQHMFVTPFVGSFVLVAVTSVTCLLLFTFCKDSVLQTWSQSADLRSRSDIAKQPKFIIAASTSVIGFALMSFIMTATPVHMHVLQDFSLEQTKWVIQSHIVAMYLPSFFSALLIQRAGISKVIKLGLLIYVITMSIGLIDNGWLSYWSALVLLGLGWNLLFLAGTVLLAQSHSNEERFNAQGLHDLLVFGAQAITALGAGILLLLIGWKGLMLVSFVCICIHITILFTQKKRLQRSI